MSSDWGFGILKNKNTYFSYGLTVSFLYDNCILFYASVEEMIIRDMLDRGETTKDLGSGTVSSYGVVSEDLKNRLGHILASGGSMWDEEYDVMLSGISHKEVRDIMQEFFDWCHGLGDVPTTLLVDHIQKALHLLDQSINKARTMGNHSLYGAIQPAILSLKEMVSCLVVSDDLPGFELTVGNGILALMNEHYWDGSWDMPHDALLALRAWYDMRYDLGNDTLMRIVDRQIAHLHEQLEHIDTYDSVSYDSTQESIKRMKIVKASLPLL